MAGAWWYACASGLAMRAGVGQLTNLRELRVSGNRLAGLPREVGALVKLHRLAADNNLLTSLPRAPQAFKHPQNMDSTRSDVRSSLNARMTGA